MTRTIFLGRHKSNDIIINHPTVSGRHAKIVVNDGEMFVEDLGSKNGTFVGEPPVRVTTQKINNDDRITLGDSLLPANALRDFLERTKNRQMEPGAIQLQKDSLLTFGRGNQADFPINQPLASAMHASVQVENGKVIVRDLGSANGTFVDGFRISKPVELSPGALVQFADHRYRLSENGDLLEPVRDIAYEIEVLGVHAEVGARKLLDDISLVIQPGEMVAIMGPSGAGKSTLLALLNGQMKPSFGKVRVGGYDIRNHSELFRGRIGYVPQDDILHAELTVWQALWYSAKLRLPKDMSDQEITSRIKEILSNLGLEGTENTRIGDQRTRGVSGGQRKRVNLALELLTDPPILILDEPTSGLSSTDTLSVMELLRKLADSGKTVLMTIHQPSLEAYQKFDAVAVIARDESTAQIGRLAWFGRAWPDAIDFFEPPKPGQGAPTSADGLLRGLSNRPVAEWTKAWENSATKSIWVDKRCLPQTPAPAGQNSPKPLHSDFIRQWFTLVHRGLSIKKAGGWGSLVQIIQAPLVGLLIGAVFSKVLLTEPATGDEWIGDSIKLATTMFVTSLAAIYFGCSCTAREIVTELPVYLRERMVGLSIPAYLFSKMTLLIGTSALQTSLLLGVVYWSCGFHCPWLALFPVLFMAGLAGGAIGLFLSAYCRTVEAAAGILPLLLLPMILLGGILVKLEELPGLTRPLASAIPSRWAFEGLFIPEAEARAKRKTISPITKPKQPSSQKQTDQEGDHATSKPLTGFNISSLLGKWLEIAAVFPVTTLVGEPEEQGEEPMIHFPEALNRHFILPGRRMIAEALKNGAKQAEVEIRRAKGEAEAKARSMETKFRTESEKRVLEIKNQFEIESTKKALEARKEFEAKSKTQSLKTREEIEARIREAKLDFETRSKNQAEKTQIEIEAKLKEARKDFEEKSAKQASSIREEIESKLRDAKKEFTERSANQATSTREEMEGKLRDAQNQFDLKFKAIEHRFEEEMLSLKGTVIHEAVAGVTPPTPLSIENGKNIRIEDMADSFFRKGEGRSPKNYPLGVLALMFMAGIIGTGTILKIRDRGN